MAAAAPWRVWRAQVAAAATFALLHQIGPGAAPFVPAQVATRFVVPGLIMSTAALWPGPALVRVGHCATHLLLPLLFA